MNLSESKNKQKWSTKCNCYLVCKKCKFIISQFEKCHKCKHESNQSYFPSTINVVLNVLQKNYQNSNSKEQEIAVIVFFCILAELLSKNLLVELMVNLKLPSNIQNKLLLDNKEFDKRRDLFKTITNQSFEKVIEGIDKENQYKNLLVLFRRIYKQRNKLIHSGTVYGFKDKDCKECVDQIPVLINMYVALHNNIIAKK
ncbi:hypothetical protein COY07_02435 [Candidatus Peregrinibacteria bacterium CG_4_10_14_0_2_um_filter_43_11]|nr:MAG: hypothetical protein COY07_02435 [Candidatus Peregrinibacteria bacterium CG_4_10_14_0_2_um_filter_43_11]